MKPRVLRRGGRSETGNRLLDQLPKEEYERLMPLLELVPLAAKQNLYGVNDPIRHVYFPKTGMVSVVILLEDGRQVESGTVGNEGLVGLPVVLGVGFSTHRVMCQVPGASLRLPASQFTEAIKHNPQLYSLLQRYVAASLRTTAQIVACNALHPVLERLCRWLLMIHDRVATGAFPITQEFLAEMLGVRRQTISIIAGTLQKAGLVSYRRGVVRILNRKGLEECACECYETMKTSYDQIVDSRA
jgi:CRP-like cAMP-binding protein